jgi:hypothetical protein
MWSVLIYVNLQARYSYYGDEASDSSHAVFASFCLEIPQVPDFHEGDQLDLGPFKIEFRRYEYAVTSPGQAVCFFRLPAARGTSFYVRILEQLGNEGVLQNFQIHESGLPRP